MLLDLEVGNLWIGILHSLSFSLSLLLFWLCRRAEGCFYCRICRFSYMTRINRKLFKFSFSNKYFNWLNLFICSFFHSSRFLFTRFHSNMLSPCFNTQIDDADAWKCCCRIEIRLMYAGCRCALARLLVSQFNWLLHPKESSIVYRDAIFISTRLKVSIVCEMIQLISVCVKQRAVSIRTLIHRWYQNYENSLPNIIRSSTNWLARI